MPNLLLELFSEELPASMQPKAEKWLHDNLIKSLQTAKLEHGEVKTFRTPRRIAITVNDLPERQPDVSEERKGPATSAPEQALEGFLRSTGLSKNQLESREIKGKEYYFAVINEQGKATVDALKSIIEKLLSELPWSKSMCWGDYSLNWARPLKNILCILDSEVVPIEFAHLKANNITYGHRFHAPDSITINDPSGYEAALEKAYVVADGIKREEQIKTALKTEANNANLELMDDPALLLEVTGLVEYPVIVVGSIDESFMDLPPEVMRSEMRNHQKYFTLLEANGSAASQFLIVSNIKASDGGKAVIAGNERVLRARLADGQFFYHKDQEQPLSDWNDKLKTVTFHAKIGTVAEKVDRIEAISQNISDSLGLDAKLAKRAAHLCKADLATGMVGEFPELQGLMGRYYAIAQNEPKEVANAIRDHYLPQGPNAPIPTETTSIIVALADKLDTLVELFKAGEIPTGSKDPFALRRAALGVIRIILENELDLSIANFISEDKNLKDFFQDRLRGVLKDKGIRFDAVEAVLSNAYNGNLLELAQKVEAVSKFMQTDESEALIAGYKRAANIIEAAEKTNGEIPVEKQSDSKFKQPEEKQLLDSMETANSNKSGSFKERLAALSALRAPIDDYFDKVMVNDKDEDIKQNRLRHLKTLVHNFNQIADFSKIQQIDSNKSKQAA